MRKLLSIVLLLVAVVITATAQKVTFYSEEFELGVKLHLGLGEEEDVMQSQTNAITSINLSGLGIQDLRDVVYLPNVKELNLANNGIINTSPLTVLSSLSVLDLSNNELESINPLAFSNSKQMQVIISYNYIDDFSFLFWPIRCQFTLIGMDLQSEKDTPFFEIYDFYSEIDDEGRPFVRYRGYTNMSSDSYLNYESASESVLIDGDYHTSILTVTPSKTVNVTLTNGEQSETTYVVPPAEFTAGAGKTVTLGTGLPEDYSVYSAYASKGTVEIEGNTIKYTAPTNAVTDMVNFSYYQGSTLKGFSHFYVNRAKKGDVNGDRKIDSTDLMLLVNYIMGKDPTGIDLDAADVNKDTKVNVVDVTKVVDIINKNAIGNDDDGEIHNDVEPDDPVIGIDDPLDF